nr:cyclodeaminase/cyclohydrolase family protein [Alkalibacter mobilis]
MTVGEFLEKLSQTEFPGPASGSASAASAAMAAALFEMSWKASINKNDILGSKSNLIDEMAIIREKLISLATEDMEAYGKFIKGVRVKKTDPASYEKALIEGTEPLVGIFRNALLILDIVNNTVQDSFVKVLGDLAGSSILAHGAIMAAEKGARINLKMIKNSDYSTRTEKELSEGIEKAAKVMKEITDKIEGCKN